MGKIMQRWLWIYVGAVITISAIVVVQNVWNLDTSQWAAWAQAVGVVFAVAGSFAVARYQIRADREKSAEAARIDQARQLLGLQQLAAELAQMCLLANFEKSNLQEGRIYPDAAAEFRTIADMLTAFPAVVVTSIGQMETLLHMRRIAVGASAIFDADRTLKGDAFVLKHRNRFNDYGQDCRRYSIELGDAVKSTAPGQFDAQIRTHL
jgi:hypothetical protein